MANSDLTSVEAAALLLSEGQTTDMATAELIADNPLLDLDKLARSGFMRAFGFPFDVEIESRRMIVKALDDTKLKTTCYYSGELDDKAIKRLVRACLRLKAKHDAFQA